jgi:predicted AAA+ superfamily ATPase
MYLKRTVDKELTYRQESLYFWHREAKSTNAEVDYIIQQHVNIVPIEVKSGSKGSMQSLFLFLKEKKASKGVRFSLENYAKYDNIEVFPLYAVSDFIKAG